MIQTPEAANRDAAFRVWNSRAKAYTKQYNRMKLQWELAKTPAQKDAIGIRINELVGEIEQFKATQP